MQEPVMSKLSDFIEITEFSNFIMVRKSDFRINVAHIRKIIDISRAMLKHLQREWNRNAFDVLRGNRDYQNTYVDFDIGIELCRRYELYELKRRLNSLIQSSKESTIAAESQSIFRRTSEQLLDLIEPKRTSAQNEDHSLTSLNIIDEPLSESNVHDSHDFECEQQNLQSVLLANFSSNSAKQYEM